MKKSYLFLPSIAYSLFIGISVSLAPSIAFSNHNSGEALEARVSSVGTLNVKESSSDQPSSDSEPVDGETVYSASCSACHASGVGGAPVVGEADDWVDRLAQGMDVMVENAIVGFQGSTGVMPAKGGNPSLSDEAVTAAVQFMADQSE